ncbi:hypothetical protein CJ030_MR4G015938 [Morella rubra]|uniref:Uncharacterized protein n=1 Tax=Morella rubra TaxID=262757 RepID=A0A6A1VQP1_9ROSI|nr:hypothetical protein CJ030_MR4G015938 [Morella rubra]
MSNLLKRKIVRYEMRVHELNQRRKSQKKSNKVNGGDGKQERNRTQLKIRNCNERDLLDRGELEGKQPESWIARACKMNSNETDPM